MKNYILLTVGNKEFTRYDFEEIYAILYSFYFRSENSNPIKLDVHERQNLKRLLKLEEK